MSVLNILHEGYRRASTASALFAPGRNPITYRALYEHVLRSAGALRRRGIQRDDIVAVVVPNGPEMASSFLSVSVAAICAPLNPAYTADEFEFYLSDLPAKALLIAELPDSPAREVAHRIGIPVIELQRSAQQPAGMFTLDRSRDDESDIQIEAPASEDVALVLHTSGTTSRPKIVPLTHQNLAVSAQNVAAVLELTPDDICLNVMPLFHIHGLVAALLASLHSGGGVVCGPGFISPSFLHWINEFRATWYTAVPTMHGSIASRTAATGDGKSHSLRLIRSSSASLPRTTLAKLEEVFGVPVVEAYGMTEAAHQMASNPLPPDVRKPGTVGRPAGPEIAVLDEHGHPVPPGMRGEVAIKGPNVTAGYLRNPEANAAAFTDGWLRTGDEGVFDDDGYLTILGRLKEIINRGGEKISPLEVDEVLLAHPAVAQAVTFAAPDQILGEEVAAAVVLREEMSVSEHQLREFVSVRLALFKVPRRVLFMKSIPAGPTGKPQRIGLAERLGVSFEAPATPAAYLAPRTPVEEILASVWGSVMGVSPPGVHEDFFNAGGDSILAAQFVGRVRDTLAVDMSLLSFFDSPTIAAFASRVDEVMEEERVRDDARLEITQ